MWTLMVRWIYICDARKPNSKYQCFEKWKLFLTLQIEINTSFQQKKKTNNDLVFLSMIYKLKKVKHTLYQKQSCQTSKMELFEIKVRGRWLLSRTASCAWVATSTAGRVLLGFCLDLSHRGFLPKYYYAPSPLLDSTNGICNFSACEFSAFQLGVVT